MILRCTRFKQIKCRINIDPKSIAVNNQYLISSLVVASGGAVGSLFRYWVNLFVYRYFSPSFPFGTMIVNVLGCFVIGVLYGVSEKSDLISSNLRLFLIVGICGGFTTFSTFSVEGINLLRSREILYFFLNLGGQIIFGLTATVLGLVLMRLCIKS